MAEWLAIPPDVGIQARTECVTETFPGRGRFDANQEETPGVEIGMDHPDDTFPRRMTPHLPRIATGS
jgi:hypothetical protein